MCQNKLFLSAKLRLRWKADILVVDGLIVAHENKTIVCKKVNRVNCILSNVCPSGYHKGMSRKIFALFFLQ